MSIKLDKQIILEELKLISSIDSLEALRIKYLGKKGLVSLEMKSLSSLSIDEKKIKGQELNIFKSFFEKEIQNKRSEIETSSINEKLRKENIDATLPPRNFETGRLHPISQTTYKIIEIFGNMGFSVKSGPDIETDFNNFTALNIPDHHPAREMQDTFYLDKKVLRTHTSPVQVRTMLESKPPIRIIVPGRTYRSDSDSTHTPMFHQVEGLLIDEKSTMSHLKGCLIDFLKEFFEISDLKYRFRPSYFPFTEPSAEMDVSCIFCKGKGCSICKHAGWLEILGCGMVDPEVYKSVKYDVEKWIEFYLNIFLYKMA